MVQLILTVILSLALTLPLHAAPKAMADMGGPIVERSATLPGGLPATLTVNTTNRGAATGAITNAMTIGQQVAALFNLQDLTSELSQVNANAANGPVNVSPELGRLIDVALDVNEWTHGGFDITNTGDSHKVKFNKRDNTIHFKKQGIKVSVDGILSGYLADLMTQSLYNSGNAADLMVTVNGVSRSIGQNTIGPWRIDVSDDTGKLAQRGLSLSFSGMSVAVVGMGHDHPMVNPRNGSPLNAQMKGITLLGRDGATTQAIAWAMYAMSPKDAQGLASELQNMKYVILDDRGNMVKSPGL